MSWKIDDKPQLAESSKEVGGESSWKMKSLPEQKKVTDEKTYPELKFSRFGTDVSEKIFSGLEEQMKVMEKKIYPGSKLPRSETDVLEETLIRLEEQEEEMYEKFCRIRSEIDQLKERKKELKGQSKVAVHDDERAEELNRLEEQRMKMYERTYHESISLRSVMNTLKKSLNEMEEQREKMDKKTSKNSRSETDILEETLNRLIKQKEQIYKETYCGSQLLRREIYRLEESVNRLEGRSQFILAGYDAERAEDEAELNRLKEQRTKIYERTYHESKILRSVIDTLKDGLNKLKGQIKKWNVWTDGESKWSGVDDALKFMELTFTDLVTDLQFADENWLDVDREFRNMEPVLPRRRFLYESTPHTIRFDGDFGSRVSFGHYISWRHDIRRGILRHEILGKLNVTLKLVARSKHLDVVNYFLNPLHHPNILKRIETGFLYDRICIAMEKCNHENLHDFVQSQVRTGVPFDPDKYLSYSYQLALGVQYLHHHQNSIKNLTPDVILLSVDKTTVKICEFGPITKIKPSSGTENLDCDGLAEISGDIHSLGCVFHYLWSYKKLEIRDFPPNPSLATEDPILVPNPMLARSLLESMLSGDSSDRPSAEEVVQHEIFNPCKSVQDQYAATEEMPSFGSAGETSTTHERTTSTEGLFPGMSSVVGDFEDLAVDNKGVVTKFGSLSESVQDQYACTEEMPLSGSKGEVSMTHEQTTGTEDLLPGMSSAGGDFEGLAVDSRGVGTKFGSLSGSVQGRYAATEEMPLSGLAGETSTTHERTTSTEDLLPEISSAVGDFEELAVDNKGVVTKFGSLSGGIAISKTIRKVIPVEGKEVDVGGCYVTFPSNLFKEKTPVTVRAEIDTSKWPKNFVAITPSLDVDAPKLQDHVRVKLPTWQVNQQGVVHRASVLHMPKGSLVWKDSNSTVPVTSEPYIEFEWKDFSPILLGFWSSSNPQLDMTIAGSLYASDANEVSIAFHTADPGQLVSEAVKHTMASATPRRHLKLPLNVFKAKVGDVIESKIECLDPEELKFQPTEPFSVTIGKEFSLDWYHGVVLGRLDEALLIYMKCVIIKKKQEDEAITGSPFLFTCDWTPRRKKGPTEKKHSETPHMGNVNIISVEGPKTQTSHQVAAKNYASPNSTIDYSERESHSTVSQQ